MTLTKEQKAFVLANLPLAKYVASLHVRKRTRDDYHDAVIGLCIAAIRFDATRDNTFSTFAIPTISGTMNRLWRRSQLIVVPQSASKSVNESTRNHAKDARVWLVASLDDTPIDHDWPDLDNELVDLLRILDSRQKNIILLRWIEKKTLKEIGRIFKISNERVRQLEMGALRKLRAEAKKRGMEYPCSTGSSHKKAVQIA